PSTFDLESFEGGVRVEGSSIRWLKEMKGTDMLVIPDPASAFLDSFTEIPTLVLILQYPGSGNRTEIRSRSALYREEGRGLSADDADRRHRKFRTGTRTLRVRRRSTDRLRRVRHGWAEFERSAP